jgi:hypothetical protein
LVDYEYDLFLATLGYEERARFVPSLISKEVVAKVAIGFAHQQIESFAENEAWYRKNGFDIHIVDDEQYPATLQEIMAKAKRDASGSTVLRVGVDISSVSRFRMAVIIDTLLSDTDSRFSIEAVFLYALAAYIPPTLSLAPNSHVGPILRSNFAGWWQEPDRPISAIAGLGYEPDKAVGAVEHLQAAEIWTFRPSSEVNEYSDAVSISNESLLSSVPVEHQLVYQVEQPFDCFLTLESLVYGVSQTRNVVLLPFGPKIFALCALLVASLHQDVAVWRVSAQEAEPAVNRKAKGSLTGIRAIFPLVSDQSVV